VLFGTTRLFLERLGLDSLDELPAIADFVPDASIVESLERGLRLTPSDSAGDAAAIDLTQEV
jgi:segregation and condensation protein B